MCFYNPCSLFNTCLPVLFQLWFFSYSCSYSYDFSVSVQVSVIILFQLLFQLFYFSVTVTVTVILNQYKFYEHTVHKPLTSQTSLCDLDRRPHDLEYLTSFWPECESFG